MWTIVKPSKIALLLNLYIQISSHCKRQSLLLVIWNGKRWSNKQDEQEKRVEIGKIVVNNWEQQQSDRWLQKKGFIQKRGGVWLIVGNSNSTWLAVWAPNLGKTLYITQLFRKVARFQGVYWNKLSDISIWVCLSCALHSANPQPGR